MKTTTKNLLYALWFVVLFVGLQAISIPIVSAIYSFTTKVPFVYVVGAVKMGVFPLATRVILLSSALSSVLTLALFCALQYAPMHVFRFPITHYKTLLACFLLAIGLFIPLEWLYGLTPLDAPDNVKIMFANMSKTALGYVVLGVLAPITEEVVFRGAILRVLKHYFAGNKTWIALVVSSCIFAVVHANNIQIVNAFGMGLLLGVLYLRTQSVIPSIIFHVANNSLAFLLFHLSGERLDGTVKDVFGNNTTIYVFVCIACVVLALGSGFFLYKRLHKNDFTLNDAD